MSNITVPAARFAAEAAWIAKAVPKSSMPICAAVEISVTADTVRLHRTNYDLFAFASVSGTGGEDAVVLVDAAQLASTLKGALGDAKVDITDDRLRLAIDGRIYSLTASAVVDDYPDWPEFTAAEGAVILRAPQLARALTSVSTDEKFPFLGGVKFEGGMMVSTDRFRLTRIRYDDDGRAALIPAAVLRPFASGEELVRIEHGGLTPKGETTMVRLSDWGYRRAITAPVLDAEFPKYQQLIPDPEEMPVQIVLRRHDLLGAIGAGDNVDLTVTEGEMLVRSTELRDGGVEVEQSIEIIRVIRGDELPLTVRLNRTRLTECLKAISAGGVVLMASKPDKPVLLQFSEDFHMLMPIRTAG